MAEKINSLEVPENRMTLPFKLGFAYAAFPAESEEKVFKNLINLEIMYFFRLLLLQFMIINQIFYHCTISVYISWK